MLLYPSRFVGPCLFATAFAVACTAPSKIEISPKDPVLEAAGKSVMLQVKVLDSDGKPMSTRGLELAWSTDDTAAVQLTPDGLVTAKASGDATVRVEIVGTDIRAKTKVTVQIPFAIRFSKEKLRLVTGEPPEKIFAEVITSRGAYIPGLQPVFSAEHPDIVAVEPHFEPNGRGAELTLTAKNPGTTQITAGLGDIRASVRAAVFNGDEEISMVGSRISKKKEREARLRHKKKEKPTQFTF